jgi:hypothetical protein
MSLKIVVGVLFVLSTLFVKAENLPLTSAADSIASETEEIVLVSDSVIFTKKVARKHVRAKAIIFTILTGPLGGHRVYLRTRPGAPIVYALTLGGFGILPIIDLAHLIFKKDISSFEENPKIMMWSK